MKFTEFEKEIVDSLIWQIQGFREKHVTERATNRVLRASLRRIKPLPAGCSVKSKSMNPSETDSDHAVPVREIAELLMNEPVLTRDRVIEILSKFYVSVTISKKEHVTGLRNLQCKMPDDWDRVDPFARYTHAGIEISLNTNNPTDTLS